MYGTLPVVIVKDPVGNKLTSFHGYPCVIQQVMVLLKL